MYRTLKVTLAAALLSTSLASVSHADDVKVKLTGAEETPAVTTAATGSGTIKIATDKTVTGSVKTEGLEGTAAHIHLAPAGKSGPPIITLTQTSPGTWTVPEASKLTDEQYDAFKKGELYVNIHSAAHKPGEIRGQLKP